MVLQVWALCLFNVLTIFQELKLPEVTSFSLTLEFQLRSIVVSYDGFAVSEIEGFFSLVFFSLYTIL